SGQIGGEAWAMGVGKAEVSDADSKISAFFYSSESDEPDPCQIFFSSLARIEARLPKETGIYSLPFDNPRDFTFQPADGSFHLSESGQVQISTVSSSLIAGTITARFDDGNFVEGSFALQVCSDN
ncbi:MAG: hypothetical protein AAGC88_06535, partial [Bacteroidota bacterium]